MAPFRGQPCVVEVEPADHRAYIEGRLHRVQLKLGTRYLCAVRHDRTVDNWAEKFRTGRIAQGLKAAAEAVHKTAAGRIEGFTGVYFVVADIIGDVHHDLVGIRTNI